MKMKLPQLFPLPFVNVGRVFLFSFLVLLFFALSSFSATHTINYSYSTTTYNLPSWCICYGTISGTCDKSYANLPSDAVVVSQSINFFTQVVGGCMLFSGSCSSSNTGSCSEYISGSPCGGDYRGQYSSNFYSCSVTFTTENPLPLPSCSDFLSLSLPFCKGGQGLFSYGSAAHVGGIIADVFGTLTQIYDNGNPTGLYNTTSGAQVAPTYGGYQNTPYDTISRPDNSQCVNNTEGQNFNFYICPLGFEDDFLSSSSAADNSSSSGADQSSSGAGDSSSSGAGDGASSSSGYNLCVEFPSLPGCGENGSSSASAGNDGNQSSGSGGGGTCADLSNCDWAKVDVQLTQLGVEVETRNAVRDIAGLLNNGYNISQQQLQTLQNLRNDISGFRNDIIGSVGSGADEIVNAIKNLENSLGDSGDGPGGFAEGVADGLSQFFGDTAGLGSLDSLFGDGGIFGDGGGSQMGDSLGDGSGVHGKMRNAIGIDSTSFSFFGTGGACPVFDLSFSAGMVSCNNCEIDICDIYGVDVGSILKSFVWLMALFAVIFMNLQTIKTGGRS